MADLKLRRPTRCLPLMCSSSPVPPIPVKATSAASASLKRASTRQSDVYYSAYEEDENEEKSTEILNPAMNPEDILEAQRNNFAQVVPSVRHDCWGAPGMDHIRMRGKTYMDDSVKIHAKRSLLQLCAVDIYSSGSERVDHVATLAHNRVFKTNANKTRPPFTWIVNFQIPAMRCNYGLCLYFCPTSPEIARLFDPDIDLEAALAIAEQENLPKGLVPLIREFFLGEDDAFRNDRFKMIPYIRDGPYLLKSAVPSKPCLLGRRLPIRYFRGDGYLELDIDIAGGTKTARTLTRLGAGYASILQFDVAFILEGRGYEELPEEILAIGSIKSVDLATQAMDLIIVDEEKMEQEEQKNESTSTLAS